MDEDIARWILEFLLRQPSISDQVLDSLLSSVPLSNTNSRFKKTLLLRRIESECSDGSVSENILDFLERIEELDHQDGKELACSESMKAAYCAVAVDCTVRFLEESGENNGGKYFEKVQSVWRGRVSELEKSENGLMSEELLGWKDKVEAALWDSELCCIILLRNTRNEALKAVRFYVREAWRDLGPTFLEIAAELVKKMGLDGQELGGRGPGPSQVVEEEKVGNVVSTCRELVVYDQNAVTGRVNGGDVEAERGGAGHDGESSMMSKAAAGDRVETLRKRTPFRCKYVAPHSIRMRGAGTRRSRGAKVVDSSGVQEHTHLNQYHNGPGPKVHKVQEVPRSSFTKLSQVLYDPLPEAMYMAGNAFSNREAQKVDEDVVIQNKKGGRATAAAIVEDNDEGAVQNAAHVDDDVEVTHGENAREEAVGNEGDLTSQNHGTLNTRPKRSLMDRNATAHVSEWDDSIDESASGSPIRLHLSPSPKRRNMSPLKNTGIMKITRRRQKKRWTADEEEALRTGVEKFGVGNWKLIHSAYHSRFQDRTDGDLKDKWRNLTKSGR